MRRSPSHKKLAIGVFRWISSPVDTQSQRPVVRDRLTWIFMPPPMVVVFVLGCSRSKPAVSWNLSARLFFTGTQAVTLVQPSSCRPLHSAS